MIPTVKYKKQYGEAMKEILADFFYEMIYAPMLRIMGGHTNLRPKLNVKDPPGMYLIKKIRSGDIVYDGEYFLGRFNAKSSKQIRYIGGKWDAKRRGFKLAPGRLSSDLKVAISSSKERLEKTFKELKTFLDVDALEEFKHGLENLDLSAGLDKVVGGLESQTIDAMDAIGVKYTLTHGQKQVIKDEYTQNMKLYIKDWSEEHIKTLRKDVEVNALKGYRFSKLQDAIEHRYGTSKSKAEFLAQQETSLFMAKFRQQRFLEAGVNFYIWQTVGDRKVRPDHQRLDEKIFQFGDPPVVDTGTGRRGEPGEDFRCRCIARPTTKEVRKIGGEWRMVD